MGNVGAKHFLDEGVRLVGLPGTDGYIEISMKDAYDLYDNLDTIIKNFENSL